MNFWLVFITGLTTGGLSCLAVQGGLLASAIANQKGLSSTESKKSLTPDLLPVASFLIAKLAIHTLLGFLLGWLGSYLQLSLTTRLTFQTLAALFMLASAANLLNLHPIFRYLVLQPPHFVKHLLKNSKDSQAIFTPALLGLFTILLPCGVTQSLEVLAISSGNPIIGAATMFFFILGTTPLFTLLGISTAKLTGLWHERFLKVTAFALTLMALVSLNGILTVTDSPINWTRLTQNLFHQDSSSVLSAASPQEAVQKITINITNHGYEPKLLTAKSGQPVELTLKTQNTYGCASFFVFPAFNIKANLSTNDTQTFTFTPTKPGNYTYSCSMGMYTGTLQVL